jgi:hypothetical protein
MLANAPKACTHRRGLPHRQQDCYGERGGLQLGSSQGPQRLHDRVQLHPVGRLVEAIVQRRRQVVLQLPCAEPGLPHQQPELDRYVSCFSWVLIVR